MNDLDRAIEVVERRILYWRRREQDSPMGQMPDLTTEMVSRLALRDILSDLRALKEGKGG